MKTTSAFLLFPLLVLASFPAAAAGSVEAGKAVFNATCLNCHSDPPTASRFAAARFNAAYLTSAFQRISAMAGNLALGTQTINDIAAYLGAPTGNDGDRILDWGEETYPQLLAPPRQPTQQLAGYSYRFYATTGLYLATRDGTLWMLDSRTPGAAIVNLGSVRSFLERMPDTR